jgi:nitric oxide reductase subunit B
MMNQAIETSPLSAWWRHGVILVMVIGFAVLSLVTVKTYTNAPPIPALVTDELGATIFTRDDIEAGQEVFLKYALMEHGTLWGHGAYLGPDYSAEYLHRLTEIMRDANAGELLECPIIDLTSTSLTVPPYARSRGYPRPSATCAAMMAIG